MSGNQNKQLETAEWKKKDLFSFICLSNSSLTSKLLRWFQSKLTSKLCYIILWLHQGLVLFLAKLRTSWNSSLFLHYPGVSWSWDYTLDILKFERGKRQRHGMAIIWESWHYPEIKECVASNLLSCMGNVKKCFLDRGKIPRSQATCLFHFLSDPKRSFLTLQLLTQSLILYYVYVTPVIFRGALDLVKKSWLKPISASFSRLCILDLSPCCDTWVTRRVSDRLLVLCLQQKKNFVGFTWESQILNLAGKKLKG